jgi:hypothetical protein
MLFAAPAATLVCIFVSTYVFDVTTVSADAAKDAITAANDTNTNLFMVIFPLTFKTLVLFTFPILTFLQK